MINMISNIELNDLGLILLEIISMEMKFVSVNKISWQDITNLKHLQ